MKIPVLLAAIVLVLIACNSNNTSSQSKAMSDTNENIADKDSSILKTDTGSINFKNKKEPNNIIIPGERIGRAELNTDAEDLEAEFGKPDRSDAAMGKAWLTWFGKSDEHKNKTQLDIYTTYKDTSMREKTVQQVRTTSSYFSTEQNIHVYSSFDEIQKVFPGIQKLSQRKDDGRTITVYDDVKNGIAFEIADVKDQNICTGIFIHIKGKKVTDIYIPVSSW